MPGITERHHRHYINRVRHDPRTRAIADSWVHQAMMEAEARYRSGTLVAPRIKLRWNGLQKLRSFARIAVWQWSPHLRKVQLGSGVERLRDRSQPNRLSPRQATTPPYRSKM